MPKSAFLQFRVAQADVRVKAAAGGGDGVGGNGIGFLQAVFFAVGVDAVFDGVVQFLRSRAEIAAAGVGGIIAVAGGRGTRVKIFLGR